MGNIYKVLHWKAFFKWDYLEVEDSFLNCKTLDNQALISSYRLPRKHKDPFDRMIIWQAIKDEMILLSVDGKMNDYIECGLKIFENEI